jgi:hypothetical protein
MAQESDALDASGHPAVLLRGGIGLRLCGTMWFMFRVGEFSSLFEL